MLNVNSLTELDSHPIRGASWETFVIEDLVRREKLRHPHVQFYFWRTAAGAEVDLVLDSGSERTAIEIKAGRGDNVRAARLLEQAAADIGAARAWILDQGRGHDPLRPNIERRGLADSLDWLLM